MDCKVKTFEMEEGNLQSVSRPSEHLRHSFYTEQFLFYFKN